MKLTIKNMNCPASEYFIKLELEKMGIQYNSIKIGEVELAQAISKEQLNSLNLCLKRYGLEIVDRNRIINGIKLAIAELLDHPEIENKVCLSEYVSRNVSHEYYFLNDLFIKAENITIEKYLIILKIQKAKDLLIHHNLSMEKISKQLNFNSVTHFTNQFAAVTGIKPMRYKKNASLKEHTVEEFAEMI